MFTGIVQGLASVSNIEELDLLNRITLQFPEGSLANLNRGASIAINGCCLTVTDFSQENSTAKFDVMKESLRITNLGRLKPGAKVNYERAAKFGDEIGGHSMSGHVSGTATILERHETATNCELVFEVPEGVTKYLMPKGYVGLDGCSLTIGPSVTDRFSVFLIPETLAVTRFGFLGKGDVVNLEIDPQTQAIVDTVERYMSAKNG